MKRLSIERHDAVKNSPVGKFIDRLIREEVERGGNTSIGPGGNVIQQLWNAFNSVPSKPASYFETTKFDEL